MLYYVYLNLKQKNFVKENNKSLTTIKKNSVFPYADVVVWRASTYKSTIPSLKSLSF